MKEENKGLVGKEQGYEYMRKTNMLKEQNHK